MASFSILLCRMNQITYINGTMLTDVDNEYWSSQQSADPRLVIINMTIGENRQNDSSKATTTPKCSRYACISD